MPKTVGLAFRIIFNNNNDHHTSRRRKNNNIKIKCCCTSNNNNIKKNDIINNNNNIYIYIYNRVNYLCSIIIRLRNSYTQATDTQRGLLKHSPTHAKQTIHTKRSLTI